MMKSLLLTSIAVDAEDRNRMRLLQGANTIEEDSNEKGEIT